MATTTAALNPHASPQRRFALVIAGDRTGEFRSARRRSIAVRTLRLLLPMLTLVVLAGYALTILQTAGIATNVPELSLRKILPQDLAMNNPRYEGFGIPVLEAMACGTPVVTSRGGATEEVAGGAAVLVDPRDPASIAAGIEEADRRRDSLVEVGRARASMFTWRRAADLVEDLWRELV